MKSFTALFNIRQSVLAPIYANLWLKAEDEKEVEEVALDFLNGGYRHARWSARQHPDLSGWIVGHTSNLLMAETMLPDSKASKASKAIEEALKILEEGSSYRLVEVKEGW